MPLWLDKILGRTRKAEADVELDDARVDSRDAAGDTDYVGRVAGQDPGAIGEQGAERRAQEDDD
ncbi:hypothetical protein [Jatrophihabitans fulvus]